MSVRYPPRPWRGASAYWRAEQGRIMPETFGAHSESADPEREYAEATLRRIIDEDATLYAQLRNRFTFKDRIVNWLARYHYLLGVSPARAYRDGRIKDVRAALQRS